MDEVLTFIKEHWRILVVLFINLVFLIINLFKKKVKVLDVLKEVILSILPTAINEAEAQYPDGKCPAKKRTYAVNLIINYISSKFGLSVNDVTDVYYSFIVKSLENIMSTPQNEENRKKKER